MNIRVGLLERRERIGVELREEFVGDDGRRFLPGRHEFASPARLRPLGPATARFVVPDVTIGIGFHWERASEQVFGGSLEVIRDGAGLTLVNEVPIEDYVGSVIASEMSGTSPVEFLKAHALISRSWVAAQIRNPTASGSFREELETAGGEREIRAWYGREAHVRFDVCADDHCQRYQGLETLRSANVEEALSATRGEYLTWNSEVCDTRFSKCCGGVTEEFRAAWEDRRVPYLSAVADSETPRAGPVDEAWIRSSPDAWCNTSDRALLGRLLPGFDQETTDFFRWRVRYDAGELGTIVAEKSGVDVGPVTALEPLSRGVSGRIVRLRIHGRRGSLIVGKELEIRRVLSRTHLYSSAFVCDADPPTLVLDGAGWGHGVGLCQIGAGVQANAGWSYRQILAHYYPGTRIECAPSV
jgi:SpoIID/LytB domain protein